MRMLSCFAAGVGTSTLAPPGREHKFPPPPLSVAERSDSIIAPRSRALHLENLWSQRRIIPNPAEAGPRVIAALYAEKPDKAAMKEAISLLIRDPSFINRIWEQGDPAKRTSVLNRLFKELVDTNPETMLDVVDSVSFDLSGLEEVGYLLSAAGHRGSNPVRYLEIIKRNKDKMGRRHFNEAIDGAARRLESARILLTDTVMGADYREQDLLDACNWVMAKDGSLPPGTSHLAVVKKFLARKAAKESIGQWLDGSKELTPAELKEINESGGNPFTQALWNEGRTIDARKLDLLAQAGLVEEQERMLTLLVEGGRTKEVMQALDGLKDMPASKPRQSELLAAVAASIYEFGGDVGEASRLMADISDDPAAGRVYLEKVTDPDLRRVLEETVNKASLSP